MYYNERMIVEEIKRGRGREEREKMGGERRKGKNEGVKKEERERKEGRGRERR